MKKIVLMILLLFIFYQFAFSRGLDEDELLKVKGGYRQCKVYCYGSNHERLDTSIMWLHCTNSYLPNGNQEERIYFNSKGSIYCKWQYTYSENGYVIKETRLDSLSRIEHWVIHKYNEAWKIIETTEYESDGSIESKSTFQYNNHNNLTLTINFNQYDSLYYYNSYKYNQLGKLIEVVQTGDSLSQNTTTFKYNNNGNIIESDNFFSDNVIVNKFTYKYDEDGNQIEKLWYFVHDDDVLELSLKFKFRYDEFGNMTEEVWYDNEDLPIEKKVYFYSK
jgi:hypothetical protein